MHSGTSKLSHIRRQQHTAPSAKRKDQWDATLNKHKMKYVHSDIHTYLAGALRSVHTSFSESDRAAYSPIIVAPRLQHWSGIGC